MNRSSALQFDYAEAAAVADLITIVKARFIEAVDTMAHMHVRNLRPAAVRSLCPASQVETVGIGGHHPGYGINGNRVPYLPSSKAISRAEEVMYGWMLEYVASDDSRILVGKWSMCMAAPRIAGSFRQFCKKTGRSRSTAERRLNDAFEQVAGDMVATSTHWMRADAKLQHHREMLDPIRRNAA